MNKTIRIPLMIMLLAAPSAPSFAQDGPHIAVRLYDYAGVEDGILKGAQGEAARILHRAGAGTKWIECPVSREDAGSVPACATPMGHGELVLKLLPQAMAKKLKRTAETFGFAVPTSTVGLGTAFIFVKQADQLAFHGSFPTGFDTARAVVLGHLIAHEIGHLLLGPGSHSATGIMSFPWSKSVLKRVATAHLSFTKRQAELIRGRLAAGSLSD